MARTNSNTSAKKKSYNLSKVYNLFVEHVHILFTFDFAMLYVLYTAVTCFEAIEKAKSHCRISMK